MNRKEREELQIQAAQVVAAIQNLLCVARRSPIDGIRDELSQLAKPAEQVARLKDA